MTKRDDDERRARILDAYRTTGSIKATTRLLHIGRTVVRNTLRGKERTRAAPPATQPPRPSKLDAFKPHIARLVLEDRLTATLVLEEIRALGYTGGYSILKRHVRAIRPNPKVKVTTRIEHGPGSPSQVDWSPHAVTLAGESRIAHCFSLVLPFSRYMFVRYALDERLDTLVSLHEEAFSDIGAVPATITYDNMTTVGRHTAPGEVWINPRFEQYAKGADFNIYLIDQGQPNQHASVERPFHYIENNFLPRHRKIFDDLDDLNRRAKAWCDTIANVRVHGTTRERPVDRLGRERVFFKPLPTIRPEPFKLLARQVGTDFCVAVDTHRYSVPPRHANEHATVRLFADRVEVLVHGQLVAAHPRSEHRHGRSVLPEHGAEFLHWTPSKLLLEQAFLRLGDDARAFYAGLVAQRGRGAGRHMQDLLKLANRHGGDNVVAGMRHAARYGNFSYEAVAAVVTGRRMPRNPRATTAAEPPEQVRLWLAGLDVETGDLDAYDRMVDAAAPTEEDDDGQR